MSNDFDPRTTGQRALLGGLVAALFVVAFIAMTAGDARANHATITGTASCDGVVTWTATSDETERGTVTSSSRGLFDGATFTGPGSTVVRSEQLPPGLHGMSVTVTWVRPEGAGPKWVPVSTRGASVVVPEGCEPPPPPPTETPDDCKVKTCPRDIIVAPIKHPKPPKGIGHPAHAAPPHAAPVLPNTGGNDIALALFGLGLVGVGTTLLNRNRNRKGNR